MTAGATAAAQRALARATLEHRAVADGAALSHCTVARCIYQNVELAVQHERCRGGWLSLRPQRLAGS
eukprot:7385223-Prymnesium_polylepis.1